MATRTQAQAATLTIGIGCAAISSVNAIGHPLLMKSSWLKSYSHLASAMSTMCRTQFSKDRS